MGFTLAGSCCSRIDLPYPAAAPAAALVGDRLGRFPPRVLAGRDAWRPAGRHGFAQSFFQMGGNPGSSIGPLLAAFVVLPHGQRSIAWFCAGGARGDDRSSPRVGAWYNAHQAERRQDPARDRDRNLPRGRWWAALTILLIRWCFSKIRLSREHQQLLHLLPDREVRPLGAERAAAPLRVPGRGGRGHRRRRPGWRPARPQMGDLGDRSSACCRSRLALPYVNLFWTGVLSVPIGLILASAFSAILVYAQELVPGRVGMVSGLFFGFAFGIGGIGAALLGDLADPEASSWCTGCARSCRRSACSPRSCPTSSRPRDDGRPRQGAT